tara:strand:- start:34 stop:822 length:789 start_codon:yes stop_codon:yes gene_type:complete
MQNWKKIGGINRAAKNQNFRATKGVVTGDYVVTKDNKNSGVQFSDTTKQITAAENPTQGYWYDLSDDNVNIYRDFGSVNVGKKNPTKTEMFSEKQIFDLNRGNSNTFGNKPVSYQAAQPYQISEDGELLVIGDYDNNKIYSYVWDKDLYKWKFLCELKKTLDDNDLDKNLNFGANISLFKRKSSLDNAILAVSYPGVYLYLYCLKNIGGSFEWSEIYINDTRTLNFYQSHASTVKEDKLSNWGWSISLVSNVDNATNTGVIG